MNYLALGDSISIDDYTEVAGGGAASQFADLVEAHSFQNLTRDGGTTKDVLESLKAAHPEPDVVTLTVGGNDLLMLAMTRGVPLPSVEPAAWDPAFHIVFENLTRICARLSEWNCPVVLNTIYDPTDGDDSLSSALGLAAGWRRVYNAMNDHIKTLSHRHDFLLSDLEHLFHGHGIAAANTWFVLQIEPNHAGATAIARHWHTLL